MNRIAAAVVALGGVLAVQAATAADASAHAVLESSTPADGAMLATPPAAIELVFSEAVGEPAGLSVLAPDGTVLPAGELEVVDDTMRLPLAGPAEAPGVYTVSYDVTSADGHPVGGTLTFMVHAAGTEMPAGDGGGAPSTSADDTTAAEPAVVIVLAALLAGALAVALLTTRRLALGHDDGAP